MIKELKDLITPARMMSGDEDEIHAARLNQVEGLDLNYSLRVSFPCGVNADEVFDDPDAMTSKEKTTFRNDAGVAFAGAALNCAEQDFDLRLFKYDADHPGALSTISYSMPLNAEQVLALHDGAAQYDVVDIYPPEKWLTPADICTGAWISDEPCKTQLIKGE
jgi:hypothetical protein